MEPWGVSGFPASCSFPCLRKSFKRKVNNPADEGGDDAEHQDDDAGDVASDVVAPLRRPEREDHEACDGPQDW